MKETEINKYIALLEEFDTSDELITLGFGYARIDSVFEKISQLNVTTLMLIPTLFNVKNFNNIWPHKYGIHK